jgi:hypothetical protein
MKENKTGITKLSCFDLKHRVDAVSEGQGQMSKMQPLGREHG